MLIVNVAVTLILFDLILAMLPMLDQPLSSHWPMAMAWIKVKVTLIRAALSLTRIYRGEDGSLYYIKYAKFELLQFL